MSRVVRGGVVAVQLLAVLLLFFALPFTGGRHTAPARAQSAGVCQANPSPPDPADPSIVVTTPAAGDRVANPLSVSGSARVFEAVVSLSLKAADGSSIADGTVQANEGAPTLSPFSGTLPFSKPANTPACLWVFEASAQDGSPANVVQVPLTLLAPAGGIASAPAPASSSPTPAGSTPVPAAASPAPAASTPAATPVPTSSAPTATGTPASGRPAGGSPTPSSTPAPRPSATPAPARQVTGTPLRRVDWVSVLANDPYVQVADGCSYPPGTQGLPCVSIQLSHPQIVSGLGGAAPVNEITGFADVASGDVLYGDIDGDGADEAVISIDTGGTGGAFGLLVYHQASPAPQIVDVIPGYKIGAKIESGTLVVTEPFYFGFEANCCPTGLVQTSFVQVGDNLQVTAGPSYSTAGQDGHQVTPAELTVIAFYNAIDQGRYQDAYALTSAAYQAANPFDAWKAFFTNVKGVALETQPGTNDPNSVLVNITAQVQGDAGTSTHTFAGSWSLVPNDAAPLGLLLDSTNVGEVSTGQ